MEIVDSTFTYCPYCNTQSTNMYAWRIVTINSIKNVEGTAKPVNAVEIYCTQCKRTLSITPLVLGQPQAAQ